MTFWVVCSPFFARFSGWRWVALGLGETEALQLLHHLNSWNSWRSHSVISHNAAISSCEKSAEWRWALCLLCHGGSWIGLKETSTVAPIFFLKRWLLNHQDIDYIGDSSINDGWSPIMIRWFIILMMVNQCSSPIMIFCWDFCWGKPMVVTGSWHWKLQRPPVFEVFFGLKTEDQRKEN